MYSAAADEELADVDALACGNILTADAVAACDPLDGVLDEIISNMTACRYSPYTSVNWTFQCADLKIQTIALIHGAAAIANAASYRPRGRNGNLLLAWALSRLGILAALVQCRD